MTQEETIFYIKAYMAGDIHAGNYGVSLFQILQSAIEHLSASLVKDVDSEIASFNYRMEHGYPENMNEMEKMARHFYELGKNSK